MQLQHKKVTYSISSRYTQDIPKTNRPFGLGNTLGKAWLTVGNGMGEYVAMETIKLMLKKGIQVINSDILILGFTFKENCPDVRNTKVIDIYKALKEYNLDITVYDPWANPAIVEREYGIKVVNELPAQKFDACIAAVAHKKFEGLDVPALLKEKHVVFDVKCTLDRSIIDGRL